MADQSLQYAYDGALANTINFATIQMQNQLAAERAMSGKKKNGKKNAKKGAVKNDDKGDFQIETTLHGYPMVGPFTPGQKDVWYCDNKTCNYTQHGVYRRYKIQNWRSSQFGKKFVLCDGCVRQYQKVKPQIVQQQQAPSNVNVKLNVNGGLQQQQQIQQYPSSHQVFVQQPMMLDANGNPISPQQQYQQQQPQQVQQQYQVPVQNVQQYQEFGQAQSFYSQSGNPGPQYTGPPQQQQAQVVKNVVQGPIDLEQKSEENDAPKSGGIQIVKQGWMMKKGDIVKSWKKRYFVLKTNQTLNYYESDNAVMVKGTCMLNKVKSVKKKSGQSFDIDTPKRKWQFACKDTKTRDDWVAKIRKVAQTQ